MDQNSKLIGIISDTHGLVRSQALEALAGTDMILHAGDIGNQQVLDTLKEIAPVVAVRGGITAFSILFRDRGPETVAASHLNQLRDTYSQSRVASAN